VAKMVLLNTLESAWVERKPFYGCSWDMSNAFDSVSKPLIARLVRAINTHAVSSVVIHVTWPKFA